MKEKGRENVVTRRFNVMLTEEAAKRLRELQGSSGLSASSVFELAIRRLHGSRELDFDKVS